MVSEAPPTWLSEVIARVIASNNPTLIAQAIANSPKFLEAIREGLAHKPQPGLMAPSHAHVIANKIRDVIADMSVPIGSVST